MKRNCLILLLLLFLGCRLGDIDVSGGPVHPSPVTLTSPTHLTAGLSGSVLLSAALPADGSVVAVQFQVDGSNVGPEVLAAPWQMTIASTSAYASGQHVVRARGRDAAHRWGAWSEVVVSFGGAVTLPSGFSLDAAWITGLNQATSMTFTPDGRLFVTEQSGAVRVVKAGVLLPTPLLTLTVDARGERGLLGVAMDPAFPVQPYVYCHYTALMPLPHNRISRFTVSGDLVLPNSELALIDLPPLSSATNHNGGALHFGLDGKLYVGVGDNANGAQAQDLTSPFGKLLRFNADGGIPSDNPYATTQFGLARGIWALGLRNPFTFAFQPATGLLHINDVGQNAWEEINLGDKGANFGWPTFEGPSISSTFASPRFAYGHLSAPTGQPASTGTFLQGSAIAGGAFYPASGGSFPTNYAGSYFFADFGSGWVARMDITNGTDSRAVYTFANLGGNPVDLRVGPEGALYVLGRTQVQRITYP